MVERRNRSRVVGRACAAAAVLSAVSTAWAGYEVPNPLYNAPGTYYSSAAGLTGTALKSQLYTIITTGFHYQTYGDSRYADWALDQDPNNANNILLTYNHASVPGTWDAGVTWNREHVWPKSLYGVSSPSAGYTGPASDLFEVRPANPNLNSTRDNYPYGYYGTTGAARLVTSGGVTYWYPGDADTGDVARAIFYMATRYGQGQPNGNNFTIVNGNVTTGSYQMGDLNSLLHWNYSDGVDNFERRRNYLIYTSDSGANGWNIAGKAAPYNKVYNQGNRNPFIDHPEYVWAVFGGGNNNSQIHVGASSNADGSSATTVDLGRAIVGAALPAGSVAVSKTGANPTTFDVAASGVMTPAASALQVGTGQPFDYNNVTKTMTVQLTASTATAGVKTGTVTINNTDLTTGGAGLGSADGDDVVTVTATVVDHATGSLAAGSTVTAQAIDFGYVPQGFASRTAPFAIANRPAASGFTADLALNSIATSGSGAFATDAATFAHLAAGSQNNYTATLSTGTAGALSATRTFNVSDEAIPGAAAGPALGLTMTARVIAHGDFAVSGTLDLRAGETFSTGPSSIGAGVTLVKSGPGMLNIDGPQANGAGSKLDVAAGAVFLGTDAGANLDVAVHAGGSLRVQSAQHLHSLTVDDAPDAVNLLVSSVTLASADAGSLRHALLTGSITSTAPDPNGVLSVGYVPSGAAGYILQPTYVGDANLDGAVDGDDYALLDRGLAQGLAGWVNGDFNYDGVTNVDDFLLIDRSFAFEAAGGLSPSFLAEREARFGAGYVIELVASVPEPSSVFGFAGVAMLLGRRRRAVR